MISKSQQISALARDAGETMTEAQQALARRDYEAALAGLRDAAINLAAIGVLRSSRAGLYNGAACALELVDGRGQQ